MGLAGAYVLCDVSHALDIVSNLNDSATWTVSDSPVRIAAFNFTVGENAALTIEPGVTVMVTNAFNVEGRLLVQGMAGNPVVFEGWGGSWGPLYFKRGAGVDLMTNVLCYGVFTNMNSYIYVSQQTLYLSNCFLQTDGYLPYMLCAYVNTAVSQPYADAQVHVADSEFHFRTGYATIGTVGAVSMDGMRSSFRRNRFCFIATNNVASFIGFRMHTSNTQDFESWITDNRIDVLVTHLSVLNTYGIQYEAGLIGAVSGNSVRVDAPQSGWGIQKNDLPAIIENTVTMVSTSAGAFAYVYGILSENTSAGFTNLIVNNSVSIQTDQPSRYAVGLHVQNGRTCGNRVTVVHAGVSGWVKGVLQVYYGGAVENNTVQLSADQGISCCGIDVSTHYNSAVTVLVQNNICMVDPEQTNTFGLWKDDACAAVLSNRYNCLHGFDEPWHNCASGSGSFTNHPLLDAETYRPDRFSPVTDAGINEMWMITARDPDGFPRIDNQVVDIGAYEYFREPDLVFADVTDGTLNVVCGAISGGVYRLERSGNLADASSWSPVDGPLTGEVGQLTLSVTGLIEDIGFYRPARLCP